MRARGKRGCRRLAVALVVSILVGQGNLPVNAEEESLYGTPAESSDMETDEKFSGEESALEEGEEEGVTEKGNEEGALEEGENAPDETESGETETEVDSVIEDEMDPGQKPQNSEAGELFEEPVEGTALEAEMSVEAKIMPMDIVADKPVSEGGSFHVNMATEPNIRLVCQVIDGEKRLVTIQYALYDGEASDELAFPQTVSYYGWDYTVTEIGIGETNEEVLSDDAPVTKVIVPEGVTVIRKSAFRFCRNLTTVELPDGLTVIEQAAFANCPNLCGVRLPDSVTVLGASAFAVSALETINLPPNLGEISHSLFSNCTNLKSITLPDTITAIGGDAFSNTALQEIRIPDTVIEIGDSAFYGCSDLEKVRLPSELSCINPYMFEHCTSLRDIEIPSKVTRIEDQAFWDCPSLQMFILPASVTYLGYGAFAGCSGLTELRITVAPKEENGERHIVPVSLNERRPDSVFANVLDAVWRERKIVFLNGDVPAVPLTGDDLNAAIKAYMSVKDGNVTDNLWYEWKLYDPDDSNVPGEENPPKDDNDPGSTDKPDNNNPGGSSNNTDSGSTDNADSVPAAEVMEIVVDGSAQASSVTVAETVTSVVQNDRNQTLTDKSVSLEETQRKEPKTGDLSHMEVYATIAMIAGMTWLLLYFMEERRGMTERKKEVLVAAFVSWAKKGGTFRKCCAMAAIFCILVYYYAVGRHTGVSVENREIVLRGKQA